MAAVAWGFGESRSAFTSSVKSGKPWVRVRSINPLFRPPNPSHMPDHESRERAESTVRVTETVLEELWDRKRDRHEPLDDVIRRHLDLESRQDQ